MDSYLHHSHSMHVQFAQRGSEDSDSDDDKTNHNRYDTLASWVMLSRDGEVVKLPGESIFYKTKSRISLDLQTHKELRDAPPFSVKSDGGTVFITTRRVIYLPTNPTESFKSFSAPVLNFENTQVASYLFGSWYWEGLVKPVTGGNIPPGIPRLQIKLTFKEGGHDSFRSKFELIKERLHYARQVEAETGQVITIDEPLPQYEAAAPASAGPPVNPAAPGAGLPPPQTTTSGAPPPVPPTAQPIITGSGSVQANQPQPVPNEPPPGYEEAQAQAVDERLEDRLREEAERQ